MRIVAATGTLRCPRCGRSSLVGAPGSAPVGPTPVIGAIMRIPTPSAAPGAPKRTPAPAPPPATVPGPTEAPPAPPEPSPTGAPRIAIGGGPRTGKTTIAESFGWPVRHTDDLIGKLEWSAASTEVARWMEAPGPWVIEGVAVARALRKALIMSPRKPCDLLVWLTTPHVELTAEQATMGKGCDTVLGEIRDELVRRGVTIETLPHSDG